MTCDELVNLGLASDAGAEIHASGSGAIRRFYSQAGSKQPAWTQKFENDNIYSPEINNETG
jgi:hypothetical protein